MVRFFVGRHVTEVKGDIRDINKQLKRISQQLANEVVPNKLNPEANKLCKLGIYEFLKNVLHGGSRMVEVERLPDGGLLLFTSDKTGDGQDLLDPNYCGKRGRIMIQEIFGKENHRESQYGDIWQSELHVYAGRVLRAVG